MCGSSIAISRPTAELTAHRCTGTRHICHPRNTIQRYIWYLQHPVIILFFFYPTAITTLNKLRIWCYIKDMMHKSISVHLEYRNANEVEKVGNKILDGYSPIWERWMVETLKDSLTGWRTAAIAWQQGMGAFIYSNITSFHDSFHQAGQRPGEDMAIYQPPRLSSHMYRGRLCRQRLTEQCMEPDSV